jgi:hypothetical protein
MFIMMFEVEYTGKGIPLQHYPSFFFRLVRDDAMGENETSQTIALRWMLKETW